MFEVNHFGFTSFQPLFFILSNTLDIFFDKQSVIFDNVNLYRIDIKKYTKQIKTAQIITLTNWFEGGGGAVNMIDLKDF